MTQHYYKKSNIALVCYDITNQRTWEKVGFWVSELRAVEPNVIISIVGTKLDLVEAGTPRAVSPSVVSEYAVGIGAQIFETSALNGSNIDFAFSRTVGAFCAQYPDYLDKLEQAEKQRAGQGGSNIHLSSTARNNAGGKQCAC
mmetsp:Transcript_14509/g.26088  ORF Transcript_14509/g.26088 Transcript_14509/m.26088 type:complete len:143 (-) Transcript_14509:70-498(-)